MVVQFLDRDVHRVVVTATFRAAVGDIVLGARRQFVLRRIVAALITLDLATAIWLARYGSSPAPSAIRPQRGSCVTSIIGAYVQVMPLRLASAAETTASVLATPGSKLDAWPSGIGKLVV